MNAETDHGLLKQQLSAAKRLLLAEEARGSLLKYTMLGMPDPDEPDNPEASAYIATPQGRLLCQVFEKAARGDLKRVAVSIGPQLGKLVADDTPIWTPDGWREHGDLKPGDRVWHPSGQPATVLAVSAPDFATLEVETTHGDNISVHPNHEWTVFDNPARAWKTMTTAALSGRAYWGKRGACIHLPLCGALEGEDAELPLDPYVLGAWLGDGTYVKPCVTHPEKDQIVVDEIVRRGFTVSSVCTHKDTGVLTTYFSDLKAGLEAVGVMGDKHVPTMYLTASRRQRAELLAGLLDTDGTVHRRTRRVTISNTNRSIVTAIETLVRSLGWRATTCELEPRLSSSGIQGRKPVFMISFSPSEALPNVVPRKKIDGFKVARRRPGLRDIRQIPPRPGRCIQVDAPDGLYVVGEKFTVTHNSEILSRKGPAWYSGSFPAGHLMLGTYNQDFANEFGGDVRSNIQSPFHKLVFPGHELKRAFSAKDYMQTTRNGKLAFVGVGGSGTGKPADMFVVDDPIRNDTDVQSELFRDRLWNWFNKVVFTRCHSKSSVVVVHTRWHEDDLIGRLCDPDHPERRGKFAGIADNWTYIDIPAVVKDPKLAKALGLTLEKQTDPKIIRQFGEEPMAALWEERKGLAFLAEARQQDPAGFDALYQGKPSPEDGDFFKADWIVEYSADELPKRMRLYIASDHALKEKERNDLTCMIVFGVDERDDIWVLDARWDRIDTLKQVDAMIELAGQFRPITWWAGQDHISGSIGPFLRKKMQETGTYFTITELSERGDKTQKAQAIRGRMAMGKVHFPRQAAWFQDAKKELLMFPNGTHDDFVDAMSNFGRGMGVQIKAAPDNRANTGPVPGSFAYMKRSSRAAERRSNVAIRGM